MLMAGGSPCQSVQALCAPAGHEAEEVRAMSATTQTAPSKFVTAEELEDAVKALSNAFNKVEDVQGNLNRITRAWNDEGIVMDHPTIETIGRLADFLDSLEVEIDQLGRCRKAISEKLKDVMIMRGDVELAEQKAREDEGAS
jgi:hypothetical protein